MLQLSIVVELVSTLSGLRGSQSSAYYNCRESVALLDPDTLVGYETDNSDPSTVLLA